MKSFLPKLLLAALCTALVHARVPDRMPNVVVIFADDLGYADLTCFGAKGAKTPNLDRLAREGRKFTSFHVAQAVCSASRAALLTGCYPNRIGIQGALGPLAKVGISEGEVTMAEMLKTRGYATGMAGKWHLGRDPQFLPLRHGFDEYLGMPYSNDMWPYHPEGKRDTYPNLPLIEGDRVVDSEVTAEDQAQLTTRYTERAVDFIGRNKARPFFFYLAHTMPHVPIYASEKHAGKSKAGLYADVIMEIDWSVGEVMKALKKAGVEKETLVIFTSDNGPWLSYGNHGGSAGALREGKGTAWEGGVRVPCIMRWPGRIPAGSVSDQFLMTIDLFPTIAAMTGAGVPAHAIDGRNVWPLLTSRRSAPNPHEAYALYYNANELQGVVSGDGQWKLMLPHQYRTLDGPGGTNGIPSKYKQARLAKAELYNLKKDVGEKNDVAAANPAVVQQLTIYAEKMRAELGDTLTRRQGFNVRPAGRIP